MSDHSSSNRLYNNDVRDFIQAMAFYYEALIAERSSVEDPASIDEAINRGSRALSIYQDEIREAERRVVAQLREAGLEEFAAALEADDYSGLAI